MIIDVSQLKKNETVKINGDEKWLDKIYSTFEEDRPKGSDKPLITGEIVIEVENPTYVRITGNVEYTPFLGCSRCALPITWKFSEDIDIYLLRDKPSFEDELELDSADLDEYYMEDNKNFDLEVAINDALQTARPTRAVIKDENGNCKPCGKDLSDDKPAATTQKGDIDPTNPFAALKGMKLKH